MGEAPDPSLPKGLAGPQQQHKGPLNKETQGSAAGQQHLPLMSISGDPSGSKAPGL